MSEKRFAIIHFIDGSKLKVEFPKQGEDSNIAAKMQKLLDNPCLVVEADGSLLTIPMSSIKYIQSHPAPAILPDFAIKGASIVD
jgi:hypothetical protein